MHCSVGATAVENVRTGPPPSGILETASQTCSGGGLKFLEEAVRS